MSLYVLVAISLSWKANSVSCKELTFTKSENVNTAKPVFMSSVNVVSIGATASNTTAVALRPLPFVIGTLSILDGLSMVLPNMVM